MLLRAGRPYSRATSRISGCCNRCTCCIQSVHFHIPRSLLRHNLLFDVCLRRVTPRRHRRQRIFIHRFTRTLEPRELRWLLRSRRRCNGIKRRRCMRPILLLIQRPFLIRSSRTHGWHCPRNRITLLCRWWWRVWQWIAMLFGLATAAATTSTAAETATCAFGTAAETAHYTHYY